MTALPSRKFQFFSHFQQKFYAAFIEPVQVDRSLRNREVVFNVVLVSTGLLMTVLLLLLLQSLLGGNHQVAGRIPVAVVAVSLMFALRALSRRSYSLAAYILVGFYMALAIGSVIAWDISTPFGILLLGLAIVLASTILSSRHALYAAAIASVSVIIVQIGNEAGWLTSQPQGNPVKTELGDAIGQAVVFTILGTISWLFGRETERSLMRAEAAEAALELDNATLEERVAKRTAELKQSQIDELRQLYRFAEVGQLSTALLHDLANHLTILTLDINSMRSRRYTEKLARCREAITRLNDMLIEVRDRLTRGALHDDCNLVTIINEVIEASLYKDKTGRVRIDWLPPTDSKGFRYRGDAAKYGQIVGILIGNAIDAYTDADDGKNDLNVKVVLDKTTDKVRLSVTDWGVGIPPKNRRKIFMPEFSTKKQGMGIGLYLAKQMAITQLGGSLMLMPAKDRTEFVLTLPKEDRAA